MRDPNSIEARVVLAALARVMGDALVRFIMAGYFAEAVTMLTAHTRLLAAVRDGDEKALDNLTADLDELQKQRTANGGRN